MLPNFSLDFHPVLVLPGDYEILDFTTPKSDFAPHRSPYTIGRYNEKRVGLYTHALFAGRRDNHIGIDLGAPQGTSVHSFFEGEIYRLADNDRPGDYGPTLVTRHILQGVELYALYGHLSRRSLIGKRRGQPIRFGEIIASIGTTEENGGWPPHVHFQLGLVAPEGADMPGTVSDEELDAALKIFPDPRTVLGPLY